MKKSIIAVITAGLLYVGSAFGEIKVTDNLKLEGFLDMSTSWNDGASGGAVSLDQFELDFLYDFGNNITARADINDMMGGAGVVVEQAFISYAMGENMSLTTGKFLSCSGWETAEPTGLYQYSVSKNLGADPVYGGYQNGLAFSYGADKFGVYVSAVGDVWNGNSSDFTYPGFEGQLSLMPMEGIVAKVAYLSQSIAGDTLRDTQTLVNAWVMYAKDAITIAGEFNMMTDWGRLDTLGNAIVDKGIGFIAMVNYGIGEKMAVTIRYSAIDWEGAGGFDPDADNEITISPSYAISDNVGALAEFRMDLRDEVMYLAAETIYSF